MIRKKTNSLFFYAICLAVILAACIIAWKPVYAERPNYVYDWEDLMTDAEEDLIETFCLEVDDNTTIEIVVITLKSFDEPLKVADIDDARVTYFNEYALDGVKGIGKEGEDNGVLIIFSINEGYWGIEIGYGLEGDFTDAESGRIGRNVLLEALKNEDYGDGALKTVQAIAKEVGYAVGEEDVISPPDEFTMDEVTFKLIVLGVVIIILLILWFADVGGGSFRSGRGFAGGGYSGGSGGGGGGSGGGGSSGGIRG